MANVFATKNGVWSDTTVWNTGSLPTTIDDVFSNNFSVTIDINPQVLSIRNTAAAGINVGGSFFMNNGVTLSAFVFGGANNVSCLQFLSAAPNTCTLVGSLCASAAVASPIAILNNGSGTFNIFGNLIGVINTATVTTAAAGVTNNSTGTVNFVGTVNTEDFTTTNNVIGIRNNSTGTVNVTGNVIGGSGAASGGIGCIGIRNSGNGVVNVLGNVFGGARGGQGNTGVFNAGTTGVVSITGSCLARAGRGVVTNTGVGSTTTIFGNVSGGSAVEAFGAQNIGPGILNIFGNVEGGTVGGNQDVGTQGAQNQSTGITNIVGTVLGSKTVQAVGALNISTGTLNITGNVFGGGGTSASGALNIAAGFVYINGTVEGGSGTNAFGVNNTSTGFVYVTRVRGSSFGLGSVGVNSNVGLANSQNGRAYVEQVEFGSRGQTPISGPVYILPSNQNTLTGRLTALGNTVTFYNSLSVDGLLPPVSSVQAGVVYNVGNSVGTMAVPSASAVQFGVPVDNTVGTAALQPQDVWGYSRLSATQVDSMGDRLRNTATTQSIGYQIASFNL